MKNNRLTLLWLLIFSSLFSFELSAEVYKWVDENGRVHYSDRKAKGQIVEVVPIKVNSLKTVSYSVAPSGSEVEEKVANEGSFFVNGEVVMYSASWCGYCAKARKYFSQNNIVFTEYDIEKNKQARKAYDALGAKGVPVILVGKKRMNGFSAAGFEKIYR